jgi:hypothetical protein
LVVSPFLCVLAGAAFLPIRRTWNLRVRAMHAINRRSLLVVGTGMFLIVWALIASPLDASERPIWDWANTPTVSRLVTLLGITLTIGVALRQGPKRFRQFVAFANHQPGRVWASIVAVTVVLAFGGAIGWSRANAAVVQLNAVDPGGWERYEVAPNEDERSSLPLVLLKPDLPGVFRQVSYPDAVVLRFDQRPVPGTVLGLRHTLDNLQVGSRYQFYLQVYDPGVSGDPTERLAVVLNDVVVWERRAGEASQADWQVVYLDWIADADHLLIRVERTAGTAPSSAVDRAPAVRQLHLYPTY